MSNEFEETYFDEPAPPPRRPDGPKRKRSGGSVTLSPTSLAVGAIVIAAIVVLVYFLAIRNTNSTKTAIGSTRSTTGQSIGRYKVTYPKSWAPVSPDAVAPGQNAFAAFRQTGGKGVVVMRLEGATKTIGTAYLNNLKSQLQQSVPDYKFVGSHLIPLPPGQALDFTYDRTTLHQVRNVVILPVGNVTVVMATIGPLGDAAVSRQINQIVGSFTLSS